MIDQHIEVELAAYSDAIEIAILSRDTIEAGLGWGWTEDKVKGAIRNKATNVVVARIGGELAGFGIMRYGSDKANLDLLAVKPEYRRCGYGASLVRWLEDVAATAGVFNVYVQARENNETAIKFYESLGYVVLEKITKFYRNKESGVTMLRHIGGAKETT
jgi:ribosomal-protein-alanine N-acetyltransferase